jgi:hypothetical protein
MKTKLLLLALLAFDSSAFAQTDPAKLAVAREVITAMHVDKMFDGMVAQMKQMSAQMSALPADATDEQRKAAEATQAKVMDLSFSMAKDLIGKMDGIYADVYTLPELNAMKAFFLSPEGQSMNAKQPQIMAKIMPLMQEMQRDIMPKIQKLAEEAKAAK